MSRPVQFSGSNINNIDKDFSIATPLEKQTLASKEACLFFASCDKGNITCECYRYYS